MLMVLNNLFKTKFKVNVIIRAHSSELWLRFSRLLAIRTMIEFQMNVTNSLESPTKTENVPLYLRVYTILRIVR